MDAPDTVGALEARLAVLGADELRSLAAEAIAAAGGSVLARANALLAAAAPLSPRLVEGVLLDDDMVRIILKQLGYLDGIAAMRVCTAWCTAWREVRPPTPQHPGQHQALGEVTLTHCTHCGKLLPIKWINPCAFFFQWVPGNEQVWVYLDSHAQYVQVEFKLHGRSLSMALGSSFGDAPPQNARSANPYAFFQEKAVWLQVFNEPHNGRFAVARLPSTSFRERPRWLTNSHLAAAPQCHACAKLWRRGGGTCHATHTLWVMDRAAVGNTG